MGTIAGAQTKGQNLHLRASEKEKQRLATAATIKGTTLSRFVLEASLSAADQVIADETQILLSPEAYDELARRMDEPPQEVAAVRALFSNPSVFLD